MARGRRPKPAAVKKRNGNPGKRKIVPDKAPPMAGTATLTERDVAALPVPPPPKHLGKIAAAEWTRLASQMVTLGTLRELDRTVFEARCEAYERLITARKQLGKKLTFKTENGTIRVHPLVKIVEQCERTIRFFDVEFGLTPASRARVAHVTGENPRQPSLPLPDPAQQSKPAQPQPDAAGPGGPPAPPVPVSDDAFFAGPPTKH